MSKKTRRTADERQEGKEDFKKNSVEIRFDAEELDGVLQEASYEMPSLDVCSLITFDGQKPSLFYPGGEVTRTSDLREATRVLLIAQLGVQSEYEEYLDELEFGDGKDWVHHKPSRIWLSITPQRKRRTRLFQAASREDVRVREIVFQRKISEIPKEVIPEWCMVDICGAFGKVHHLHWPALVDAARKKQRVPITRELVRQLWEFRDILPLQWDETRWMRGRVAKEAEQVDVAKEEIASIIRGVPESGRERLFEEISAFANGDLRVLTLGVLVRQATEMPKLPSSQIIDAEVAVAILEKLSSCVTAYRTLETYELPKKQAAALKRNLTAHLKRTVHKLAGLETETIEEKELITGSLKTIKKGLKAKTIWMEDREVCTIGVKRVGPGYWSLRHGSPVTSMKSFPEISVL